MLKKLGLAGLALAVCTSMAAAAFVRATAPKISVRELISVGENPVQDPIFQPPVRPPFQPPVRSPFTP